MAQIGDIETACLNPFEVREVLQGSKILHNVLSTGLNPFEVREVLQVTITLF